MVMFIACNIKTLKTIFSKMIVLSGINITEPHNVISNNVAF